MILLVAGLVAANAAEITARAYIAMGSSEVAIRQSADWSDAFDNGYDSKSYNVGGIVVLANGERYGEWSTNDVEGVVLAFTPTATDVSFAFSAIIGDLYLVDAKDNSRTKLVEGATYDFTVDATEVGTANATRFSISKIAPPATPEFCFALEKLKVNGFAGKKLSILKEDRSVLVAEFVLGDTYEFDFSGAAYPADSRFIVLFNGTTAVNADESVMKEYVIDVKPTTTIVVP